MFDIFDTSRELRDSIYEYVLTPKICLYSKRGVHIKANKFAAKNLLLVGYQFEEDYRAAAERCASLTFMDVLENHLPSLNHCMDVAMPRALRGKRKVHFGIWLHCAVVGKPHEVGDCGCINELCCHLDWIREFAALITGAREVSVDGYIRCALSGAHLHDRCQDALCHPVVLGELALLPDTFAVTIAVADVDGPSDGFPAAEAVLRWDRQEKVLHRLQDSDDKILLDGMAAMQCVHSDSEESDEDEAEN